jgi:periplasmic copper chaperone A
MTWFVRSFVLLSSWIGASSAAAELPTMVDAWIRATPPGARNAAAYMTITRTGAADRLLGAATPAAGAVEIHTHVVEAGLQRMVRVAELTLPAGEAVRLEPGGLHLMLIDVAAPFVAGTKVAFSLRFETAGTVELEVPVVDARAAGPAHAH